MKTWRATQVVNWFRAYNFSSMRFNDNVEELSKMKVMKLLYYAQGVSLATFNHVLFNDKIVAKEYGPVVEKVQNEYFGKKNIVYFVTAAGEKVTDLSGIDSEAYQDYFEISKDRDSRKVLEMVMESFGDMTAIELMKETNEERPWIETKHSQAINLDTLKDYFEKEIMVEE